MFDLRLLNKQHFYQWEMYMGNNASPIKIGKSVEREPASKEDHSQSFSIWCLRNLTDKLARLLGADLEKQIWC